MKFKAFSLILLFFLVSFVFCNSSNTLGEKSYCVNELDDSFLNRCNKEVPSGFFTLVANFLVQWINPRVLALTAVMFLLILPILQFSSIRREDVRSVLAKFTHNKIVILNFLHRVCYTLVLDVALYAVFRQLRPCKCTSDGGNTFQHVGSRYGMPSGDSMAGAIFGSLIFDVAPYQGWLARIFGIVCIALVAMERAVLGYHTVAQVTVGSCIGIFLHYYSTRLPQAMIYFDAFVQIIAGAVLLQTDPSLVYERDSMNNLFSWYVWGVSFQAYVLMEITYYYFRKQNFRKLKFSLQYLLQTRQLGGEYLINSETREDDIEEKTLNAQMDVTRKTDFGFTCIALTVLLIINFLSYVIGQEGWLTQIKK
ncbi:hypothetical protein ABK040_010192 [Willaertia magna]